MPKSETVQRLLDQIEELYLHPRNQENLKKWEVYSGHTHDNKWRGVPGPVDIEAGQIPIVVNLESSLKSRIFGFSVDDYFNDPGVYLENYLKHMAFRFTEIQDDVPVLLEIPVFRSSVFEAALFGREIASMDDYDTMLTDTPLISDLADVDSLPLPDFNQGEAMAYAKQLHEYICDQVQGREFAVTFLEWLRNPAGIAEWLYGEQEFVTAMTSDPQGAHRLMNYTTESRISWTRQRAAYLGEDGYVTAALYSDNVRGGWITPQQYLEFVQPYEMAVADLHGGVNYWHSCGDTTTFLEEVNALPLELFHVGPWTDVEKAAEAFGSRGVALEICIQKHGEYGPGGWPASDDLFRATPEEIENKIRQVVRRAVKGGATAFSIGAGPLHRRHGAEEDVKTIKRWVQTARAVLSNVGNEL